MRLWGRCRAAYSLIQYSSVLFGNSFFSIPYPNPFPFQNVSLFPSHQGSHNLFLVFVAHRIGLFKHLSGTSPNVPLTTTRPRAVCCVCVCAALSPAPRSPIALVCSNSRLNATSHLLGLREGAKVIGRGSKDHVVPEAAQLKYGAYPPSRYLHLSPYVQETISFRNSLQQSMVSTGISENHILRSIALDLRCTKAVSRQGPKETLSLSLASISSSSPGSTSLGARLIPKLDCGLHALTAR